MEEEIYNDNQENLENSGSENDPDNLNNMINVNQALYEDPDLDEIEIEDNNLDQNANELGHNEIIQPAIDQFRKPKKGEALVNDY